MDPELRPEVCFIGERRESVDQAVVRLLQSHDAETSNVIRPFELACRACPKRCRPYTHFTQLFDDMGKDILDRPQGGSGELQSPLDLETVHGSKLSEYDNCTNLRQSETFQPRPRFN